MTQADALQQATKRLDRALGQLEGFLREVFAEQEGGVSIAALKEQVRFLTEERNRARRLAAANDEVSDRLEAVVSTIKELMPASPG